MTLREAAGRIRVISAGVLEVQHGVLFGMDPDRWAIAQDLEGIHRSLERNADVAERVGIEAGEPAPGDVPWIGIADPRIHWPVDHEYGE